MIIRNKKIIDAQNELDELKNFYHSETMNSHGRGENDGISSYSLVRGNELLIQTIQLKKKHLCQLYIKQMEIYLNKEGSKENA